METTQGLPVVDVLIAGLSTSEQLTIQSHVGARAGSLQLGSWAAGVQERPVSAVFFFLVLEEKLVSVLSRLILGIKREPSRIVTYEMPCLPGRDLRTSLQMWVEPDGSQCIKVGVH